MWGDVRRLIAVQQDPPLTPVSSSARRDIDVDLPLEADLASWQVSAPRGCARIKRYLSGNRCFSPSFDSTV